MKLVVAWLAVVALAVITAGSCSVNHRSGDYACTGPSDCRDGRVCVDNFCVAPGTTPVDASRADAPMPQPDANACPAQCSSCNVAAKACTIDCAVKSCVGTQIVCPQGWNCDVLCSTPNSCRSSTPGTPAVVCTGTLSCNVTCSGDYSCRGVACGTGPCNVACEGLNSCSSVRCNNACSCDVACGNLASCSNVFCTSSQCYDGLTGGCSSQQAASCDTCP